MMTFPFPQKRKAEFAVPAGERVITAGHVLTRTSGVMATTFFNFSFFKFYTLGLVIPPSPPLSLSHTHLFFSHASMFFDACSCTFSIPQKSVMYPTPLSSLSFLLHLFISHASRFFGARSCIFSSLKKASCTPHLSLPLFSLFIPSPRPSPWVCTQKCQAPFLFLFSIMIYEDLGVTRVVGRGASDAVSLFRDSAGYHPFE